jgi:hypothetical protein
METPSNQPPPISPPSNPRSQAQNLGYMVLKKTLSINNPNSKATQLIKNRLAVLEYV